MLELDHLVVSGAALPEAQRHIEALLGREMVPGGEHSIFHTHNALMGLEDMVYLEAIAANPDAPAPARPRWYDLDRMEGPARLTNWACRTSDLDAAIAQLPEAGEIFELSRGDLHWRMAVPTTGILPFDNLFPALLEWQGDDLPQKRLQPGARLTKLTLRHPYGTALRALLAPHFEDQRVAFEEGPAAITAQFETPRGISTL